MENTSKKAGIVYQMQVGKKLYKCFVCGGQFYFGSHKRDRRNPDGTVHECKKESGEDFSQNERRERTRGYSRQRYWKWYWGFGPGARYKAYGYYSQERNERRERSRQQYHNWKNQYTNSSITIEKACEVLELSADIAKQIAQNFTKELKQVVKVAYRKLALKFHPDRNKAGDAAKKFIEITEAYERLTN